MIPNHVRELREEYSDYFKGTLMQIWKSPYIYEFIQK